MNIHGSLVMAVYIISRDGAGDGSGLIIKSSFNCILLHYNDVTKLARLSLSPSLCVLYIPCMRGRVTFWGHRAPLYVLNPADLGIWKPRKDSAALQDLGGFRRWSQAGALCGVSAEAKIEGKHGPNPSRGSHPLNPSIVLEASPFSSGKSQTHQHKDGQLHA